MSKVNVTIAIPAYNSAKTIRESIESALAQEYPLKEVLVIDDGSTDNTTEIVREYSGRVRLICNFKNTGIGKNLESCFRYADGKYIVFLCSDDVFTNSMVVSDIVHVFQTQPKIGVVGRYYYQFMNGHPGAVMVVREKNVLLSSCNPSGMAFRKMEVVGTNRIFIEMPTIVAEYLKTFDWTMLEYDTVAVRLHAGGNTGTLETYYKESPVKVWTDFLGKDFKYHLGLIQLKNRAPKTLWREICLTVELNRENLKDPWFWFCASIAVIIPSSILRRLSDFYRHRISRNFCEIIERPTRGGRLA
jgi:glycosyltransferase involved in cell wall biosynthesis